VVQDTAGNIRPGAAVAVYQPGTTTPITSTLYADGTSGTTLSNPYTSADGTVSFYLAIAQRVDIGLTPPGGSLAIFRDIDVVPPGTQDSSALNVVSGYGADPTGSLDSTTAFGNVVSDAVSSGQPVIIPPGTFKITSQLNWKFNGLQIQGAGSQFTKIVQHTANTGVIAVAGQSQKIGGFSPCYTAQEPSANTGSIAVAFGDDTVGSCFLSEFTDILPSLAQTGYAINPSITTKAGLFSCHFDGTRVLGYSYSAINLIGNNGLGAANCTGCVFDNTYIHNNFSGSDANSTWWPLYLQAWDEVVFNQLNIEHAQVFNSDAAAFVSVGNAVINGMHLEHLEISGTPGWGHVYASHATSVEINGLTIRFPTMTGVSYNSVVRLNGTEGPEVTINGLNEGADGGYATVHPLADFNSSTGGVVTVNQVSNSQITTTAINAGAGCRARIAAADTAYPASLIMPSAALAETFPRQEATAGSTVSASGTLVARLIPLRAGTLVSTLTAYTNSTVKAGGTHGWYVLMDKNLKVLAVTADQTDPSTVWGTASTPYPLNVGAAYVIPVDGYYYFGINVTATTVPNFAARVTPASAVNAAAPILAGSSSTGLTTPPSVGTTMTGLTQNTGYNIYGYVS
jgi:hypothetical protein